jgi:predicted fused transcriptional regulator/phosphomethylpyrimidine kinase
VPGKKPDYHVCISQPKDDSNTPRRCLQVSAAWVGDKAQINIRFEEDRKVVATAIAQGYDLVLFEPKDNL